MAVDVTVTNSHGTGTLVDGFTYNVPDWAPTDASTGVLLWYRADTGVSASGGFVDSIADLSGLGDSNLDQGATGVDRPGYSSSDAGYGGNAVLTFDGTQTMLAQGDFATSLVPPYTVVIVGECGSDYSYASEAAGDNMIFTSASTVYAYSSAQGNGAYNQVGLVAVPSVLMLAHDGSAATYAITTHVNALATHAGFNYPILGTWPRLNLGVGVAGVGNLIGKIAEMIVFNGLLTPTDLADLANYLNVTRAYGLSVTTFNPATDGVDCAEFYVASRYALAAGTGTWAASVGNDLAITNANAPIANLGAPVFDPGVPTVALQNADQASTWIGAGDCYQLTVIDFAGINTMGAGTPWYEDGAWIDLENGVFLLSFRQEAGPTFFADYGSYDAAPKIASVEITSLVDGVGAGRVVIQTKREGGFVWIRAGAGAWVQGDAITNPALFQTNTLVVGRSLSVQLQGTIRAVGFYTATQDDATFADLVNTWGTAL